MKKKGWWLGFALCMALTGCGARTAQVTHVPQPSVTLETTAPTLEATVSPEPTVSPEVTPTPEQTVAPTPAPQEDPKEYLLARLDQVMDGEEMSLRFWQHPASGPSPVTLSVADHGAELRELFSSLDWEQMEPPSYDYENEEEIANDPRNQPGAYGVSICPDDLWDPTIHCSKNYEVVTIGDYGESSVYLRADGSEELCDRIADIVPSVYINLGRVRVPPQKTKEDTIKLYVETAMERLKKNGHITDYVLRAYEPVVFEDERWWLLPKPEEPAWETHPGIAYTIAYAIKPAHPELSYWKDLDEDGWVNVDWRGDEDDYWENIVYDERDGCYGMY